MTTRTKLILELDRAPVKFQTKRIDRISMLPCTISEESEIEPSDIRDREIYRFEAKFGAAFYRLPHEPEPARLPRYRELLHSIADGVYGEVRQEARKLLPLVCEIDDRELRESIESVAAVILAMTEFK